MGVINYELAFRRPELLKLEHFTLMLDESSMITNPTAKRTSLTDLPLNLTSSPNKKCIDFLMGHASKDVGERVYTHKTLDELRETINLLL